MCLVPGLAILVLYGYFGWALVVFAVAGVTDALDGAFARMRHERTQLGTMLDPIADKLLVMTLLIVLSVPNPSLAVQIPVWVTILVISRDAGILIAVVVINLAVERKVFPPSVLGKATTTVQLLTIFWILAGNYRGAALPLTDALLVMTVALTLASGIHYIYRARRIMGELEARPE
jgi:cardiolipin synthase (CMP-forming)